MTRTTLVALVTLGMAGCGATNHATAPGPTPAQRYAAAVDRVAGVVERLDRHEPAADVLARRAAVRCLADWRAAPLALQRGTLERFWEITVTREAAAIVRAAALRLEHTVDALPRTARVTVVGRVVPIERIRRALHAELARYRGLYGDRTSACTAVRRWRHADWEHPSMPLAIRRIVDAERSHAGNRAVDLGVALFPADHGGYCNDPLFAQLAPDDTFCG